MLYFDDDVVVKIHAMWYAHELFTLNYKNFVASFFAL